MTERLVAGRYRLANVLGRGGMGVVWQATDELIGRPVAVKELRVPPGLSDRERAMFSERALREARTAGRLNHPGIVAIHDLVPATAQDNAVYIVMELVEAPSLAEVLQRHGSLPEERLTAIAAQLLAALQAAHSIGLIHRDVKPSNIMVLPGDEVKLLDFGIAHAVDDTRLTRHGVAGSTGYMAPELFEGADPTAAADAWALGATLFRATEGRDPFSRATTAATLRAILYEDLPSLNCSPPLSTLITALLVRDPAERISVEQAGALLRTVSATRTPAQAPAPPDRSARTSAQDRSINAGPTTPPATDTQPTVAPAGQSDWEEQPTAIRQDTVEVCCEIQALARKDGVTALVCGLAMGLVLVLLRPADAFTAAPLGGAALLFSSLGAYLLWVRRESVVRASQEGLMFQFRGRPWSADWDQIKRMTVRPGRARPRHMMWIVIAELREGAAPTVPKPFRVSGGAATFLLFATHDEARTELASLDNFLRYQAPVAYQRHGDLAALL
ncbi:serine/threonine-protein kinase [Streptomyces sp. NPDC017095]|uniref:serine/threonine-protein kinase n=1 Tax=Streptomyces sp. NPDC017095 TaxID=3364977 RepID=UPI0037A51AE5